MPVKSSPISSKMLSNKELFTILIFNRIKLRDYVKARVFGATGINIFYFCSRFMGLMQLLSTSDLSERVNYSLLLTLVCRIVRKGVDACTAIIVICYDGLLPLPAQHKSVMLLQKQDHRTKKKLRRKTKSSNIYTYPLHMNGLHTAL